MSERFFVEEPIVGPQATVGGSEAHHLLNVMRARVGQEVVLFDGSGAEFIGRIERIQRSNATIHVLERREVDRELSFRLSMGIVLPRGDRQRWLMEKLTELGVTELIPLITARGVAQPYGNAIERLRRTVIEASKQCGRNRLLEIASPLAWTDFLDRPAAGEIRLIAHPETRTSALGPYIREARGGRNVTVAIGPEGGFSDDEVSLALRRGWLLTDLGPRILRVETAAVALAALFALPS